MNTEMQIEEVENKTELPIAIEFVDTIRETLSETLKQALDKLGAPNEVMVLINSLDEIAYYFFCASEHPEVLTVEDKIKRYGSEEMIIEAINRISKAGGCFASPMGSFMPRKGTFLAEK